MFEIIFCILLMVEGLVTPYLVFTKYLKHVEENHKGFSDEETLEEASVFGFGFMSIVFFPIGLMGLIYLI